MAYFGSDVSPIISYIQSQPSCVIVYLNGNEGYQFASYTAVTQLCAAVNNSARLDGLCSALSSKCPAEDFPNVTACKPDQVTAIQTDCAKHVQVYAGGQTEFYGKGSRINHFAAADRTGTAVSAKGTSVLAAGVAVVVAVFLV